MRSTREHAAALRRHRQELVAAVSTGAATLREAVAAGAEQVKVVTLAEVVPGVGKVRSRKVLEDLGIPQATRWGELTPGSRDRLVAAIEAAGPAITEHR